MKRLLYIIGLVVSLSCLASNEMPIYNGKLQSVFDCDGFGLVNIGSLTGSGVTNAVQSIVGAGPGLITITNANGTMLLATNGLTSGGASANAVMETGDENFVFSTNSHFVLIYTSTCTNTVFPLPIDSDGQPLEVIPSAAGCLFTLTNTTGNILLGTVSLNSSIVLDPIAVDLIVMRQYGANWEVVSYHNHKVSASDIVLGSLADARLSANVDLLNGNQTYTGNKVYSGTVTGSGITNAVNGIIVAGGGLDSTTGANGQKTLTTNGSLTALINGKQASLANQGTTSAVLHGNASGNPSFGPVALASETSGTLPDGSLSTNVPLLNGTQTFSGSFTFSGNITMGPMQTATNPGTFVHLNVRMSAGSTGTSSAKFQIGSADILQLAGDNDNTGTPTNKQGIFGTDVRVSIPGNTNFTAYGSGANYTLTTTPALIAMGGTTPSITINETGVYRIIANVQMDYAGATFLAGTNAVFKLRKTSGTPVDLTSSSITNGLITTATFTGDFFVALPPVLYSATAGDTLQIFGSISSAASAGSLQIDRAEIVAFSDFK